MGLETVGQSLQTFFGGNGPELLIVIFGAGFFGWQLNTAYYRSRYRRRKRRGLKTVHRDEFGKLLSKPSAPNMADPNQQLEAISKVNFEKQRLLNRSEYRVLLLLERVTGAVNRGHRVMAQTSMGELIQPRVNAGSEDARKNAFASINSKRLDFAVVDKFGMLALAVELQGSGHYHHKTFMRDAVKREALRRAGVPLLELEHDYTDADLINRASALLSGQSPLQGEIENARMN